MKVMSTNIFMVTVAPHVVLAAVITSVVSTPQ